MWKIGRKLFGSKRVYVDVMGLTHEDRLDDDDALEARCRLIGTPLGRRMLRLSAAQLSRMVQSHCRVFARGLADPCSKLRDGSTIACTRCNTVYSRWQDGRAAFVLLNGRSCRERAVN